MVFAGGLNYNLPLQSPETSYIWDVGGQAITSGNFNTTISTDTNSVDLFHDDVLGANENFYDCDVHEKTPSYATGRLAVDSGATLTILRWTKSTFAKCTKKQSFHSMICWNCAYVGRLPRYCAYVRRTPN